LILTAELTFISAPITIIINAITRLNREITTEATCISETFINRSITVVINRVTCLFFWITVRHTDLLTINAAADASSTDAWLSSSARVTPFTSVDEGLIGHRVTVIINTITDVFHTIRSADEVITEIADHITIIIDLIWIGYINTVIASIADAIHIKIGLIRISDERAIIL
jgi:hypothetical protein